MAGKKEKEKKETKEEMNTVREKEIEVEYGEITITAHPTMQALSKFCNLYIGVEENFSIMGLQDSLIGHQEKFGKLSDKIYLEVYGESRPRIPDPSPDFSKMSSDEKKALQDKNVAYGREFAKLTTKKIKLKYLEIQISKDALQEAMDREEKKNDGILISPNDINILRKFISFI